jgi:hypothetical protein
MKIAHPRNFPCQFLTASVLLNKGHVDQGTGLH